eukprot:2177089-Pyramimonas_sp.AAC.1
MAARASGHRGPVSGPTRARARPNVASDRPPCDPNMAPRTARDVLGPPWGPHVTPPPSHPASPVR